MNSIDYIIIVLLIVFIFVGLVKGLIKEVGSIIGFFVSLWIAAHYYIEAAKFIKPHLSQWPMFADQMANVLGFIAIYFLVGIIFGLIVYLVDKFFKIFSIFPLLQAINRGGGAAIGLIEGLLFVASFVLLFVNYPISKEINDMFAKSKLVPYFSAVSSLVQPFFPDLSKIVPDVYNSTLPSVKEVGKEIINKQQIEKNNKNVNSNINIIK